MATAPQPPVAGYDYGQSDSAHSPVTLEELRQIEQTAGWTSDDAQVLQRHVKLFERQAESMVDAWRGIIAAQPHLAKWFFTPEGQPDDHYKARVKQRFVQWVVDAGSRPHDQAWLDYQQEIGLRHTPDKKNQTDHAQTPPRVPFRYLLGFYTALITESRRFFVEAGVQGEELQRLEDAWARSVLLHIVMWSRPYVRPGWW